MFEGFENLSPSFCVYTFIADTLYMTIVSEILCKLSLPVFQLMCLPMKKRKNITFISVLLLIHDPNNFSCVVAQGCPALRTEDHQNFKPRLRTLIIPDLPSFCIHNAFETILLYPNSLLESFLRKCSRLPPPFD